MDDANQTDSFLTSIRKALKDGENGEVLALLEGIDVKVAIDSDKQTLLHLAATYGNAFITDHLVKCECIVDATDKHEITPLTLAVYFRHAEVMRILIDAGADLCKTDSKGKSPIFYIKMGEDADIIRIFKSAVASKKACKEKAKKLYQDSTYKEMSTCKKFFLYLPYYSRSNLNNHFYLAFRYFVGDGPKSFPEVSSIMQMILYYSGASVNDKHEHGDTALHIAARELNYVAISWLLDRGADVNARDQLGRTPLHNAYCLPIQTFSLNLDLNETVELLIRNGADLHAISFIGETILSTINGINLIGAVGILRQLTLLEARGKPLIARDLDRIESDPHMNSYYKRCKTMVQQAKQYKILDDTTLFDLLLKNIQTLTAYAKNKNFREKFTSLRKIDDFSVIAEHFLSEFIKCVDLLNITEEATVVLSETLPFLDDLVIARIIQYLTSDELLLLTKSNSVTTK